MPPSPQTSIKPVIIVHGGAWAIPQPQTQSSLSGIHKSASAGYHLLVSGATCIQAVTRCISILEDDPVFDAGTGSVLNEKGDIEMDAAIMTESHGSIRAGGVACISNTRHPILVAEQVMHTTPHTLIVGKGADDFADEIGLGGVEKTELVSAGAMEEWAEFKKYGTVVDELFKQGHDTVGAVALDVHGNIAAGTSTGGITYKRAGRIGDSPILGSGLYVDARVGGVSTTGHGESIAKVTLARYVTMLMQTTGISVQRAVEDGLKEMKDRTGGCGGCIAIDVNGETGVAFSTQRMVWACVDGSGKMRSGIDRDSVS